MPFPKFLIRDAKAVLGTFEVDASAIRAEKYYTGDHWQGGSAWIGPMPSPGDPAFNRVVTELVKAFVSSNLIKEVIDRHIDAVLNLEPVWSIKLKRPLKEDEEPTEEEKALIKEAETLLTEWWDRRMVTSHLRKAMAYALFCERGPLRIFIPRGKIIDGRVPKVPVENALLRFVWFSFEHPKEAAVVTNLDTMEKIGVYMTKAQDLNNNPFVRVASSSTGTEVVELSWVDEAEEDETELRVLSGVSSREDQVTEEYAVPLGGNLTVHEIERSPIINTQVVQNQNLANMAMTMMQRNAVIAGFLERVITNAEVPVEEVVDPTDPTKKIWRSKVEVGPGKTAYLQGRVVEDAEGRKTVADVGVYYRDPVDPKTLIDTYREARHNILNEAKQLHVEMNDDATASAVSRVQARADFITSLADTKKQVDAAIRWTLDTALHLAGYLAGFPKRFDGLSAYSDVKVNGGPLTPAEIEAINKLVDGDLMSRETAVQLLGATDVDAELAKIDKEIKTRPWSPLDAYQIGYQIPDDKTPEIEERMGLEKSTPAQIEQRKQEKADSMAAAANNLGNAGDTSGA